MAKLYLNSSNLNWPLAVISMLFVLVQLELASTTTINSTVDPKQIEDLKLTNSKSTAAESNQRPGARSGRMLDLDKLAGHVTKSDPKEPSVSGNRQSRLLADGEGRSRKGQRKMTINGFIPIVSLDDHQASDSSSGDSDEDSNSEAQQLQGNLREHLASSFGGQTSIGHASFANNPNDQWQQVASNAAFAAETPSQTNPDQAQEAGRVTRKLLGSSNIFSGLANKGFVSQLVPSSLSLGSSNYHNQVQHPNFQSHQLLQGPMNVPMRASTLLDPTPTTSGDCICVPFFQCKNGFLSESQLSKSQLMVAQAHQFQAHSNGLRTNPHHQTYPMQEVPRSLPQPQMQNLNDLHVQQAQNPHQAINQQQFVNDIYDQLRKNIESGNLDQQMVGLIDERHANGTQAPALETEERSLISRRQHQQQKCGIMRTCCRVPPRLDQLQQVARFVNGPQVKMSQQPIESAILSRPQSVMPTRLQPTNNNFPGDYLPTQQQPYQMLQQTSPLQGLDPAPPLQPMQSQLRPQQKQPSGSFMSGRCGVRQTLGISGRVQNYQAQEAGESSADFGEFPAHAAILKRISPGDSLFVCSAVLISNQWLATAAHCVRKHRPEGLKIRLGEWDVNRDDEFYPFFETNVREVVLHPDFQSTSLINDIALLRLEQPVDQQEMPHVAPACLAQPEELPNYMGGQRCWVAGWGKNAFGQQGAFQSVLRKVDLPVVSHQDCEFALKHQTKLGKFFRLHANNICAGGERGKDACEGDGGAGLYCLEPQSNLIKAVGLVSWGVGCGQRGVPGVYVNLANLSPWIESVVVASGEENVYLDGRVGANSLEALRGIISERSNSNATLTLEETTTTPAKSYNQTATS